MKFRQMRSRFLGAALPIALAVGFSAAVLSSSFAQIVPPGMGSAPPGRGGGSSGSSMSSHRGGGGGLSGGAMLGIGIGVGAILGAGAASQPPQSAPAAAEKKQVKTKRETEESRRQARAPAPKSVLATHPQAGPDCEQLLAAAGSGIADPDRIRDVVNKILGKLADAGGTRGGAAKILSVNKMLSKLAEECKVAMFIQSTKPSFPWAIELIRSGDAVAKPLCIKVKTESGGEATGFIDIDKLTDEQLAVILHDCENTVETMTYYHPMSGAKVRVLGRRNGENRLVPIVADTDLLALGFKSDKPVRCDHDDSSQVREDDNVGRATERERRWLLVLNAPFGEPVFQHGAANRAPDDENAAEIKYPIYMFDPGGQGQNRSIDKGPEGDEDKFLKQFVNELADRGYWIAVHPLWKQKVRGKDKHPDKGWTCNDGGHWTKLLRNQLGLRSESNITLASQVPEELLSP